MITVFCGDDLVSSRKAFLDSLDSYKEKGYDMVKFNGKDLTEESLELSSGPTSLFGEQRLLVIEGLLSGTKSKEKEKVLEKIAKLANATLVIWEGKDFSKIDQAKYPNFVFKNSKLPSSVFSFLDKLSSNKPKENILAFHKTISEVEAAFVFIMLVRQIRMLILASENELANLPSWQSGKFIHQAKLFTQDKLLEIYKKLLAIDFRQKTSAVAFDLKSELDLLLIEI